MSWARNPAAQQGFHQGHALHPSPTPLRLPSYATKPRRPTAGQSLRHGFMPSYALPHEIIRPSGMQGSSQRAPSFVGLREGFPPRSISGFA